MTRQPRPPSGRFVTVLAAVTLALLAVPAPGRSDVEGSAWFVRGADTREERSWVARIGAGIDEVHADGVVVTATDDELRRLRARFDVEPVRRIQDFPAADSAYHTYDEMVADLAAVQSANPSTVRLSSIGRSYEGRELWMVRIGDDAADNTSEPGVLFVGQHHAREHLTVEVVLSLVHLFAESADPAVRDLVATRQIYLIPSLNPDGGEYDVASGRYRRWRKNRQPNTGTTAVGTDPNRNYSYRWGCCGGSSGSPSSETYRGPAPFSAPENAALRDFVLAHANIRTAISYHSYGDLILYPYGYTYTDVPSDMRPIDHQALVAMAAEMARTSRYRPQQSSDLYITDGDFNDWMYGERGIYAFTIELGGGGFYPADEIIPAESQRNHAAAVYVAGLADCPLRAAGDPSCGGGAPPPPVSDAVVSNGGFESALDGWNRVGALAVTSPVHNGAGAARLGGANNARHSLSQDLVAPAGGRLSVWVRIEGADTSVGDRLSVYVASGRRGRTLGYVFGNAPHDAWREVVFDLSAYAGQTVTLTFRVQTNRSAPDAFYLDDVAVA